MNEKCKYCDYVSKCSRICEYNSVVCKLHRSFPKIVDKSYEQLQQENQELKLELSGYRQAILKDKEMLGLKEENQKYKEVIDKATMYINSTKYSDINGLEKHSIKEFWFIEELEKVLKEVE